MENRLQHLLWLTLHRLLDLCRDVRGLDVDPGTREALSKAEQYAWKWLGEYRHADPAQQSRLLSQCVELEKRVRLWIGAQPPQDHQLAA
jgi:hypothetical protein